MSRIGIIIPNLEFVHIWPLAYYLHFFRKILNFRSFMNNFNTFRMLSKVRPPENVSDITGTQHAVSSTSMTQSPFSITSRQIILNQPAKFLEFVKAVYFRRSVILTQNRVRLFYQFFIIKNW